MMSRTGGLLLPADVPRKYTLRKVALMDFVLEFVGPRLRCDTRFWTPRVGDTQNTTRLSMFFL